MRVPPDHPSKPLQLFSIEDFAQGRTWRVEHQDSSLGRDGRLELLEAHLPLRGGPRAPALRPHAHALEHGAHRGGGLHDSVKARREDHHLISWVSPREERSEDPLLGADRSDYLLHRVQRSTEAGAIDLRDRPRKPRLAAGAGVLIAESSWSSSVGKDVSDHGLGHACLQKVGTAEGGKALSEIRRLVLVSQRGKLCKEVRNERRPKLLCRPVQVRIRWLIAKICLQAHHWR
mmetsp:Transcript_14001/g.39947  ORF Transcript_14001/g.39947 Transcript_14001/m.39947 type:complete len:232 (-) Transcript_14001:29-724(-)